MSATMLDTRSVAVKISRLLETPARIELLFILRDGPRMARELGDRLGLSRLAVLKHLAILRAAEIIAEVPRSSPPRHEMTAKGRRVLDGLAIVAEA